MQNQTFLPRWISFIRVTVWMQEGVHSDPLSIKLMHLFLNLSRILAHFFCFRHLLMQLPHLTPSLVTINKININ